MGESVLRVKNWREFQHYTNRRPPWIKFHVTLLDDYEFQCLPLASRALAPMLWLLASQNVEGSIPADPALLAFRLRWDVKDIKAGLTPLIQKGFLIDASNVLATCLQSATSETETETETEGAAAPSVPGLDPKAWELWIAHRKSIRKPIRPAAMQTAAKQLAKLGAAQMLEVERAVAGGWQGLHPAGNVAPAKPSDPYRGAL